ncbi:mitochondrial 54S ribosomal protein mL49 IMG2 [Rhodotorula paludigena]|uniref:mitochondrial 54S ribosomal protein mL49 IMG2 n=1 Tax=Rhodotorula paludigena TaxID=86838 RepID=UPI003182126E
MQSIRTLSTAAPTLRTRTAPVALPLFFAATRSSSSTAPAASPVEAQAPPAPTGAPAAKLPTYSVPRTRFGQLPVYTEFKKGGAQVFTVIRKAEGDIRALQTDLSRFLRSVSSQSKPAQGQVILRGDWTRETKEWLAARGF